MGMFHGRGGSITWAGTGSPHNKVTNWTVETTADVVETTAMSDANYWKTYLAGFKDWTASVDFNYRSGSDIVNMLGTGPDKLTLTMGGNHNVSGNAICTGISASTPVDGIVTATASFQGSGELSDSHT